MMNEVAILALKFVTFKVRAMQRYVIQGGIRRGGGGDFGKSWKWEINDLFVFGICCGSDSDGGSSASASAMRYKIVISAVDCGKVKIQCEKKKTFQLTLNMFKMFNLTSWFISIQNDSKLAEINQVKHPEYASENTTRKKKPKNSQNENETKFLGFFFGAKPKKKRIVPKEKNAMRMNQW